MKNLFKKIDKKHLAVYLPLSVGAFVIGGISPLFILAVGTGLAYIAWQVIENA